MDNQNNQTKNKFSIELPMKILYLMHVNWYWIRQRPQVLAEELARNNELLLLHFAMYHRNHRADESSPPFRDEILWRLPERILRLGGAFEHINATILKRQLRNHLCTFKPNAVWVTHPVFEPIVRQLVECTVIYDCMDDHLAFHAASSNKLAEAEKRLVQQADLTFFSSKTLAERVNHRSRVRRAEIINNGVTDNLLQSSYRNINHNIKNKEKLVFGYYGTISHWFDWLTVFGMLESMPYSRIKVAGPVETNIPKHPRIEYVGIIKHSDLTSFVKTCDVLIMPFIVNRLIEAVDPVKLYEYITYGIPILAPRYTETERFLPWVSLYESTEDAIRISMDIDKIKNNFESFEDRYAFLDGNTWQKRSEKIEELISKVVALKN